MCTAVIAVLAAWGGKSQGELFLAVAFVLIVVGDLVVARHSYGRAIVEVDISGDGIVDLPMGAVVRVHGNRYPLWMRLGWWDPRWFAMAPGAAGWVPLVPRGRGWLRWLDVDIVARGPLGLWEYGQRMRMQLPMPAAVAPRPVEHTVKWPELPARPFGDTVLMRGADELVRGIREYRPGDARKLVHWPATAHYGRLLVRETEALGTIRVRIAVYVPRPGLASEMALGRAAWLALDCIGRGWEVELITTERIAPPPPPLLAVSPYAMAPPCSLLQEAVMSYSHHGPPVTIPGAFSLLPPAPIPVHVVVRDVRSPVELTRRLATVAPGSMDIPPARVATRVVSPEGDQWL